jgi:hypothetical protein
MGNGKRAIREHVEPTVYTLLGSRCGNRAIRSVKDLMSIRSGCSGVKLVHYVGSFGEV